MNRTLICIIGFLFVLAPSSAYPNSGEKHAPAEKKMDHGMMHGEAKEKSPAEVLHTSMAELNQMVERIFHSIILSQFDELDESAAYIRKVAAGLKVTKPHRKLVRITEYRKLVEEFEAGCVEFERDVKEKKPAETASSFGNLIATCVECHVNFRDTTVKNVSMTRHYVDSVFLITDEGWFSVEMLSSGIDFLSGESSVDIIIHDTSDHDVEGGAVEAFIWTPENGILGGEKLSISELSGGRYTIKDIKPRQGEWGLYVKVRKRAFVRADDVVDGVVFDISSPHQGH
jgi:hypothetical protein